MAALNTIDHVPAGWIVLDVMRNKPHSWRWVALVVEFHPQDELREGRRGQSGWFFIPGKYKNRDAAWDAMQDAIETRH